MGILPDAETRQPLPPIDAVRHREDTDGPVPPGGLAEQGRDHPSDRRRQGTDELHEGHDERQDLGTGEIEDAGVLHVETVEGDRAGPRIVPGDVLERRRVWRRKELFQWVKVSAAGGHVRSVCRAPDGLELLSDLEEEVLRVAGYDAAVSDE